MGIPASLVEEIKRRFDLVSYIHHHYTPLRKEGSLWVGSCPFHSDSDPSFKVFPKGYRGQRYDTFYCFGCGAGSRGTTGGSDAIAFIQRAEGATFEQAIAKMAAYTGVKLAGRRSEDRMERLCREYERQLVLSQTARQYLASRGISIETARRFRVGYVPPSHPIASLRHRLTFPVTAASGQVLGFAYRALEEHQAPKYRLSKGLVRQQVTFGLHQAWPAIQQKSRVVLLEGPFDAMALYQKGIAEAVAILGVRLPDLRSLAGKGLSWYVWLDGDDPGRRAVREVCETLASWGEPRVYVIRAPGRADPDEVVQTLDPEDLLSAAPTALAYFASMVLEQAAGEIDRIRARALLELGALKAALPSTPEERRILDSRVSQALLLPDGTFDARPHEDTLMPGLTRAPAVEAGVPVGDAGDPVADAPGS